MEIRIQGFPFPQTSFLLYSNQNPEKSITPQKVASKIFPDAAESKQGGTQVGRSREA